ncbi:hypothetical protein BC628DRAFT_819470 [Trametes gibbosa]|nr:hypothetical protein BC628DRAFT_819470 [Trametes gibbosa]
MTGDDAVESKERTDTRLFMAIELLDNDVTGVLHATHHDLESFIWVLVWIVLRHTEHNHRRKTEACSVTFIYGDDDNATSAKRNWVMARETAPLAITNNAPLTNLLAGLHKLLLAAVGSPREQRVKLTCDAVLAVLESTIYSNDGPVDHAAVPFVPPKLDLAQPTKRPKKRTRRRCEDESEVPTSEVCPSRRRPQSVVGLRVPGHPKRARAPVARGGGTTAGPPRRSPTSGEALLMLPKAPPMAHGGKLRREHGGRA